MVMLNRRESFVLEAMSAFMKSKDFSEIPIIEKEQFIERAANDVINFADAVLLLLDSKHLTAKSIESLDRRAKASSFAWAQADCNKLMIGKEAYEEGFIKGYVKAMKDQRGVK